MPTDAHVFAPGTTVIDLDKISILGGGRAAEDRTWIGRVPLAVTGSSLTQSSDDSPLTDLIGGLGCGHAKTSVDKSLVAETMAKITFETTNRVQVLRCPAVLVGVRCVATKHPLGQVCQRQR
jgi:hypothetical protein